MKNVTISWSLPTVKESGAPLDISEIANTEVYLSADGGSSFVLLNTVVPTAPQEAFIPDLEVGNWSVRLIVVGTNGKRSANTDTAFAVPDESAPGIVTNVVINLT